MEAVNVIIRFRQDSSDSQPTPWEFSDSSISLKTRSLNFRFDSILLPDASQGALYEVAASRVIHQLQCIFRLEGFNCTVFAYGQSGSGKTFSMLGPEEVAEYVVNGIEDIPQSVIDMFGIIPRSIYHIFQMIEEGRAKGVEYSIKCSYIEVYNESINDLLSTPPKQNLKIRELPNEGMVVQDMEEHPVKTPEEFFECLALGTANRITASTGQNSRSSRSHTVVILLVNQVFLDGKTIFSKLNLVDLAGSEKLSKTGATGQTLKEAQKINLSLTTLGRCIKALTSKAGTHIPFRESKLTKILRESLGGNAKTSLICTASMKRVHLDETISTLKFAERAKHVQNNAKTNVFQSREELLAIIEQLKKEIVRLKRKLAEKGGGQTSVEDEDVSLQYRELQASYESLQQRSQIQISDLQEQLKEAMQNQVGGIISAEFEGQIEILKTNELNYLDQIGKLQGEIANMKRKNEELQDEVESLGDKLQEKEQLVQQQSNDLQQQIEERDHEIEFYKEKYAGVKAENGKLNKLNIQLQATNVELSQNQVNTKADSEEMQQTITQLNFNITQYIEQIEHLKSEYQIQQQYYHAQLTELQETQQNEISQLHDQIESLTSELTTIRHNYSVSSEQYQETNTRAISALKESYEELIEKLRSEIKQLKAENLKLKQSVSELEKQLRKLQQEADGKSASLQQLTDKSSSMQTELINIKEELKNLRKEKAGIEQMAQTYRDDIQRLQTDISELTTKNEDLTQSNLSLFKAKQEAVNREKRAVNNVNVSANKNRLQISQLKKQAAISERNYNNIQVELMELQSQLETMQKELTSKNNEISALESVRASLTQQITDLQAQLKEAPSPIKKKTDMFGINPDDLAKVRLRRTSNAHLKSAIAEAKKVSEMAPASMFKVYYGFDLIKWLYMAPQINNIVQEKVEEEDDESSSWTGSED